MAELNVALEVFKDALLQSHRDNLNDSEIEPEQKQSFTESELISIAESLWLDRYSDTRKTFQQTIGRIISEKVESE